MPRRPRVVAALGLIGLAMTITGCNDADKTTGAAASSSLVTTQPAASSTGSSAPSTARSSVAPSSPARSTAHTSPPPPLAGTSEAAAVAVLPAGRATGSVIVTYNGLGEARSSFDGTCAHAGNVTTLKGTAGTARVVLTLDPNSSKLTLDDVGVSSTAALAKGRVNVQGNHLVIDAPLVQANQAIGRLQMDVTCTP